MLDNIVERN